MLTLACKVNSETVKKRLAKMATKAKKLDAVRKEFAEYMVTSTKRTFAAGGRPSKWKPSKRALAKGGKTLLKTGRLKKSITGRVKGHDVLVGTNVVYARVHQMGIDKVVTEQVRTHSRRTSKSRVSVVKAHTRSRRMRLPKRPFLKMLLSDRRYLRKAIKRHMEGGK